MSAAHRNRRTLVRPDRKQRGERGIDGIMRPQLHAHTIDSFSSQKFHPFAETGDRALGRQHRTGKRSEAACG